MLFLVFSFRSLYLRLSFSVYGSVYLSNYSSVLFWAIRFLFMFRSHNVYMFERGPLEHFSL